jgi:serine/threonine-protein kinase
LYADAFEADATLADDLRWNHRLRAARSAALAGCGQGADAACLEETERKRWRDQAREWLQADLAARVHAFAAAPQATRTSVRKALARWREDPELECVRKPGKLDKLTADERQEFLKFWAEVAAVLARMEQ